MSSELESAEGGAPLRPEIVNFLKRYVLIRTPNGYVLGRSQRSDPAIRNQLRERRLPLQAERNFQLRVRKGFPSAERNFQLRVRKGFPSAENNFQLRVSKNILLKSVSGLSTRFVQVRKSDPSFPVRRLADNNFQLRVRKPYPSAERNFQLRVRKAFPSAERNFQLRVRSTAHFT